MLRRTLTAVTLNSDDIANFKEVLQQREKEYLLNQSLRSKATKVYHEEESIVDEVFLNESPVKRSRDLIPSDDEDDLEGTLAKHTRF